MRSGFALAVHTCSLRAGGRAPISVPGMAEQLTVDPDAVVSDEDELVEDELLVEEISIDGMCGVY